MSHSIIEGTERVLIKDESCCMRLIVWADEHGRFDPWFELSSLKGKASIRALLKGFIVLINFVSN